MDAKDNVFINNRFSRTLLKLKRYLGGTPTRRGSKHANSKKIKQLEKLVRLQKKADRKRAYSLRRINRKRARGVRASCAGYGGAQQGLSAPNARPNPAAAEGAG